MGGSAFGMISSIKNNIRSIREVNFYKNRQRYNKALFKSQIVYKKATKEELLAIRNEVKRQNKIRCIWEILIYLLLLIGIAVVVYWLFE